VRFGSGPAAVTPIPAQFGIKAGIKAFAGFYATVLYRMGRLAKVGRARRPAETASHIILPAEEGYSGIKETGCSPQGRYGLLRIFYFRSFEMITFVIGGARSGKSKFALEKASACKGKKIYIATAQAFDDEMAERIGKHKKERSAEWESLEEPLKIKEAVTSGKYDVILLDCLTLWLSNLLLNNKDVEKEIDSFCSSLPALNCSLFAVSNEVGLGIVPDNELSRKFRDLAGCLNQKVAKAADEVYLVTAGIPLKIK
jgi:adenosylcobinamide kinase/adenosylcobinamide-phosphate guanylyltransferase